MKAAYVGHWEHCGPSASYSDLMLPTHERLCSPGHMQWQQGACLMSYDEIPYIALRAWARLSDHLHDLLS